MIVIPAIDLYNKQCVRLTKGRFDDITTYDNPIAFAEKLEKYGAKMIHLCDLSRSKDGLLVNIAIIKTIIARSKINIQIAGGIKNEEAIKEFIDLGVNKIVLSVNTILSLSKKDLSILIKEYLRYIVVSIDGIENKLVKNSWQETTAINLIQTAKKIVDMGFTELIYTDVSRDGTLTEPNVVMVQKLMDKIKKPIIVAGGIRSISQIRSLQTFGIKGVIVGKALFDPFFDLEVALNLCWQNE